jgi:hypothetical protein
VAETLSEQKKTVTISKQLYDLIEGKMNHNNFKTVDNYVEHILGQVFQTESSVNIDPEEEEKIKKRLERLGYL